MYKLPDGQLDIYAVYSPLEQLLDTENRFVRWAREIPWEELERELSSKLYARRGAPAAPLRLTLGITLLQQRFNLSDAEVLRQVSENPYMQYFIGRNEYTHEPPCSEKLLRSFRGRLGDAEWRLVGKLARVMR